jgi:hypothetical protein
VLQALLLQRPQHKRQVQHLSRLTLCWARKLAALLLLQHSTMAAPEEGHTRSALLLYTAHNGGGLHHVTPPAAERINLKAEQHSNIKYQKWRLPATSHSQTTMMHKPSWANLGVPSAPQRAPFQLRPLPFSLHCCAHSHSQTNLRMSWLLNILALPHPLHVC